MHHEHLYMFIGGALTHREAVAACRESGSLAMADDTETYGALRLMLIDSRAQTYNFHVGAWLDGRLTGNGVWNCEYDKIACGNNILWAQGKPDRLDEKKCVLLWLRKEGGVTNDFCARNMSAICEVK